MAVSATGVLFRWHGRSTDVGPLCKTVEDAALMLGVIAGYDPADPAAVDVPVPDYSGAFRKPVSGFRVGLPRTAFFEGLDPEFAGAVDAAIAVIKKTGGKRNGCGTSPAVAAPTIWGPETYAWHKRWLTGSPDKYQPATWTQTTQRACRNALRDLEQRVGFEIDDPGDLENTTIGEVLERRRPGRTRRSVFTKAPRENSKNSQVIAMLKRPQGTTIEEIMTAMQWQKHTTRALLSAGGSRS